MTTEGAPVEFTDLTPAELLAVRNTPQEAPNPANATDIATELRRLVNGFRLSPVNGLFHFDQDVPATVSKDGKTATINGAVLPTWGDGPEVAFSVAVSV